MSKAFFLPGEDVDPRVAVPLLGSVLASNLVDLHESETQINCKESLKAAGMLYSVLLLFILKQGQVQGCEEIVPPSLNRACILSHPGNEW